MHASIVSFYGAFFREGAVHVALEYMDASLLDISRAQGRALPEAVIAGIARPVLEGLVYLHRERHMIHRDVKPANILVNLKYETKLCDFGFARSVESESNITLSSQNQINVNKINKQC